MPYVGIGTPALQRVSRRPSWSERVETRRPGGDDLEALLRGHREVDRGLVRGVVDRGDPAPGVPRPVVGEDGLVAVPVAARAQALTVRAAVVLDEQRDDLALAAGPAEVDEKSARLAAEREPLAALAHTVDVRAVEVEPHLGDPLGEDPHVEAGPGLVGESRHEGERHVVVQHVERLARVGVGGGGDDDERERRCDGEGRGLHRTPPSPRNSRRTRSNSRGQSAIGTWPQPSRTTRRAFGSSPCSRSA
jgi:hypothetical protein